jgi:hypothetical protein
MEYSPAEPSRIFDMLLFDEGSSFNSFVLPCIQM